MGVVLPTTHLTLRVTSATRSPRDGPAAPNTAHPMAAPVTLMAIHSGT